MSEEGRNEAREEREKGESKSKKRYHLGVIERLAVPNPRGTQGKGSRDCHVD